MAHLKTRVDAIERKAKNQANGYLCVQQDLNDPALYHGKDGATYTDAELLELANRVNVIRLVWATEPEEAQPPGTGLRKRAQGE